MKKDYKRMTWLLLLMMFFSLTPAFALTTFGGQQPPINRYYSSQAYYPRYYPGYGYDYNYGSDFVRKMYILSRMAQQNPDGHINYSSTSAYYHSDEIGRHPIRDERKIKALKELYSASGNGGYGNNYQNGDKVVNVNVSM